MRKYLLLVLFIITVVFSYSQNSKTKALMTEINNDWEIDDNGNVSYSYVIEAPGLAKDDIYESVLNYIVYNYGSGKSVIQTKNKEDGKIIGKGIYDDVYVKISLCHIHVDCWHILRVDVKDGKARIIITLTKYDISDEGGTACTAYHSANINQVYPITQKGSNNYKNLTGNAFYNSHKAVWAQISAIEKSIKEGVTSSELEDDDW